LTAASLFIWGLGEDIYFAINPEPEEVVEPYTD